MALLMNQYGKGRVRTLRVKKDGDRHEVRETSVLAILQGGFAPAYLAADNSTTVSTDTVKNVVNVVARDSLDLPNELFCLAIARRFLHDYPQVDKATITASETKWSRLVVDGVEHPHSFTLDGNGKPSATVTATRAGVVTTISGIEGFTFLKSTQSGWSNFYLDLLTTLKPTDDRIAATSMLASWTWAREPESYPAANKILLDTMLKVFATTYSNSVQDSLYRMGMAGLAAVPELETISMACPNKHYLPMNLAPFGMSSDNTIFIPTDEPHGQIECTVGRD
jgi:urate oxidase